MCLVTIRLRDSSKPARMLDAHTSIMDTGLYEQTHAELAFGAQLAWRNASRCIGRIQWSKLQVCWPIIISYVSVLLSVPARNLTILGSFSTDGA